MSSNLESSVAGIPCQIQISYFFSQPPMGPRADSDMDCYGYTDSEWTVCDRRGRPAPWLDRKLTADDKARIEQEIEEFMQEDA